jgi:hypothetical protein
MSALTPEREKLRDAIDNQRAAQQSLDEARRAQHVATERWSAANARSGNITRQIEALEEAPPDSGDDLMVASLAKGGDLATLDRPISVADELRAQLEASEDESAKWRRAQLVAEQAIEFRRQALDLAERYVDNAARAVADVELNVDALIAESEAARQAVLMQSAALFAARRALPDGSAKRRAISDFLAQSWCAPNAIERASGGERLAEWFTALTRDPTAKAS